MFQEPGGRDHANDTAPPASEPIVLSAAPSIKDVAHQESGARPPARAGRQARRERAAKPSPPFSRVAVFDTLAGAAPAWRQLESVASLPPYQTLAWAEAWMETEGAGAGVRPLIGVAYDRQEAPVALLPFVESRRGLFTIAGFLGGRHANYNIGLFVPEVRWTTRDMRRLLRAVGAARARRPDVFALFNQPLDWDGRRNPMALLPHQASPSHSHRTTLEPDGEAHLHRLQSASTRKKLRSKTAQLESLGPVSHLVARTEADIAAVLDAHVAQKATKLTTIGATGQAEALAETRRFLARAATGDPAILELHALRCGPRIVATFGGLAHAGHYSGLIISYESDPDYARLSPGEILLTAIVRAKCAEGLRSFDLGIGESRYKSALCPVVDPLFDSLLPLSVAGHVFVAVEGLRLTLKRWIKQSSWAWPLALTMRRKIAALRRTGPRQHHDA